MLKELTNVPLVIAAHGTRDPEGVAVCRALAERVRAKLPDTKLTMGFVELTEPSIPEAVAEALEGFEPKGEMDAVVVPLMLATGGHVRIDIPEAIDEGRGEARVAYSAALLGSPLLDSAVRNRVVEVLGEWRPQDTACVLVGRGSPVTESNAERYRMARTLMEETELRSIHPAFIQVSRPSVPEALNHAKATGVKQITSCSRASCGPGTWSRSPPGARTTRTSRCGSPRSSVTATSWPSWSSTAISRNSTPRVSAKAPPGSCRTSC